MGAIHHFIPTLLPGDGTGNAARAMQHRIKEIGLDSLMFVQEDKVNMGYPIFDQYKEFAKKDDILIYHLATSSGIPSYLKKLGQPVVVYYQNLTPAKYFRPYDSSAAALQDRGMAELKMLGEVSVMGMAPSKFNLQDLSEGGFPLVEQVPIILDPTDFMGKIDNMASKLLFDFTERGFSNWLFVGRLVPNKAQEYLIMALAAHREIFGDTAVLHLVGRPSYKGYARALYELTVKLELEDRVNFVMGVSAAELASFYAMSDVFISASEHEGFCMPIVEALFHGLPVIAYDAAAVPETLGIGGVHLPSRDSVLIATWANRLVESSDTRNSFVRLASQRTNQLGPKVTVKVFDDAIAKLINLTNRNWTPDFNSASSFVQSHEQSSKSIEHV